MQGFIIHITRLHEEDLIVTIIAQSSLMRLYRFYGARHSTINIGYQIDFEAITSVKSPLPHLRDITHLAPSWLTNRTQFLYWQQFISLFFSHLYDTEAIGTFYFNLLVRAQNRWDKQDCRRTAIETYTHLLEYEGRLHTQCYCIFCDLNIEDDFTLIRAFIPAHTHCAKRGALPKHEILPLLQEKKTIYLETSTVDTLFNIILEGL